MEKPAWIGSKPIEGKTSGRRMKQGSGHRPYLKRHMSESYAYTGREGYTDIYPTMEEMKAISQESVGISLSL